ncbi:MAG TPA: hypothetical protein VGK67_23775 [Myxococcales bacterium]|jgi:hypothetical protein
MKRLLLSTVILGAAILIARGPTIHPMFTSAALAGAREMAAYRLDASAVRFPLSEGTRCLRILTNLDLPPSAPPEGVGFSLRVRIPEEHYEETFALVGMARVRRDGTPAAFYLGEPVSPAWTREIALERRESVAAHLEVSLLEPEGAHASIRVLAEAERAPLIADLLARRIGPIERNHLASSLGPLDWDQLPQELQADLLNRHWARIPASPEAQRRRLYVAGEPAPIVKPEQPMGDLVEAGQVVAYTAQGPGTLRLAAVDSPITGTVELLQATAKVRTLPLALKAGDRLDLALDKELTTARVRFSVQSQIVAVISDKKLAVAAARLDPRPDGEWVLHPAVGLERNPRAEPEPAPPVVYDLRGRAERELRLSARLRAHPDDKPAMAHVRWTMRDEQRRAVASGTVAQALAPTPEDRIDEEPGAVPTEALAAYLWPPVSASTLEIASDPPALVAVDSPGFAPPPIEEPQASSIKSATALRHGPVERPLWFRVRPSNEDDLLAGGRIERLRSAVRLERIPPRPPPAGLAESLEPLEKPPMFTLLAPGKPDAPLPDRGVWWPLSNGVGSVVRFEPLPGSSPEARVPWNLLYLGDASIAMQEVAIRVDSDEASRATLFTPRGVLALAPAAPGAHRVRIGIGEEKAAPGVMPRLFVNHPTGSQALFRSFSVFPLSQGERTTLRLHKNADTRSLGVVLYFDGFPGEHVGLEATIDAGHRSPPLTRSSRLRTRLTRTVPVHADALPGASYLNRSTEGVWGSPPLFVGLADDIPAGDHLISLALKGTSARVFARFFSYGGPQSRPERFNAFGEARSIP